MGKIHQVEQIKLKKGFLELVIDEKPFRFELSAISRVLAAASDEEKKVFEVTPSGYGIHWPLLDEDISIDALLGISHQPSRIDKTA